jgi:hypothetical protein
MKTLYKNLTVVFLLLTLFISQKSNAQCSIAVTQSTTSVCAGSPVTLRAKLVNINVGTGANGSINVSSTYHTDSVRSAVSGNNAVGTNTITVASSTGFAVGQEILIITMVDPATSGNLVGQYEFATIASIASNTLTLTQNKVNTYNASATLKHQVVRVPQYQNITVTSAGILTCNNWNGTTGGVLAFRATGTVTVNASGNITAAGKGYRGVAHNTAQYRNADGAQGEGIYGQGFMGAASSGSNGSWNNANGTGGGGGTGRQDAAGGGGGGYAAVGIRGTDQSGHFGGTGGIVTGAASLARLYLGGAGGEGGSDEDGGHPGPGGNGGGIVFIAASTITGAGNIAANGAVGGDGSNNFGGGPYGMGGGGGGAGGSLQIQAGAITLPGSAITAIGGTGGGVNGGGSGFGGAGSEGRIRVDMPGAIPVTNPVAFQGTFPAVPGTTNYTWSTTAIIDSIVVSPTTTTTYSVTAVNASAGCSTNTSYQVVVTPLPTAPVTVNGSRCAPGSVTLSATSAAGTTVRWYSSATGGSPIGFGSSFNTPSIATTTTYYAEVIPESLPGDTLSSLRFAAGLRKLKTNYTGNAIKLRRSSDNATQIFGFAGNEIDTVAIKTWLGVSTAFVEIVYDQSGYGNNVSQTVTGNQPTFVLNGHNGRPVLRFNTSQFLFNEVNFPTPFSIVTSSRATGATGRVFGGRANNWLHGYWSGARNQFHYDGWNWNGNVTSNMTLPYIYSGTGNGTTATKVYENGTLLANVAGGYTGPNGIVLNGYGNWGESSNVDIFELFIYNAVIDDNSRIFVESSTSNRFNVPISNFVTASGSGCASSRTAAIATISTNAFNLPDSTFGCGDSVLVTADAGYSSYAWNGGGTVNTKWIKTTGWARCTVTGGTCGGTQVDSIFVTMVTRPTITASTPASRCGTGTVTLGATSSAGTINWYSALTGGTSLATGASFTTPSIAATTTYFVDATANGCTTATRTSVAATVNTIPTITASTPASRCGTGTVALGATASAGTINWYSALTGGTSLATGATFTTPSIAATTTYFVDATANGCTTAARTSIAATVNTIPTITASTPASRCGTGTVALGATASAGTINWYSALQQLLLTL